MRTILDTDDNDDCLTTVWNGNSVHLERQSEKSVKRVMGDRVGSTVPYHALFVPITELPNSLLKLDPFKPFMVN